MTGHSESHADGVPGPTAPDTGGQDRSLSARTALTFPFPMMSADEWDEVMSPPARGTAARLEPTRGADGSTSAGPAGPADTASQAVGVRPAA